MGALVLAYLGEPRQFKAQYGVETETPLPNFKTAEEVMDTKMTELVSSIQIAADQIYDNILA